MAGRKSDFTLTKLNDLFTTQAQRDEEQLSKIRDIPLELIDDFPDHPFKVRDDEDMMQLVESVKERGVITPATVRQKEDGRYELVSGHRRKRACELAGFETLRSEIVDLNRDEATILMVESNFQRSEILPSEKAFAYKMRLEAMKRQAGRPSKENASPLATNFPQGRSDVELAEQVGESKDQIRRYIRLTNLVPELLEFVDEGRIKMRPAVELSYLDEDCQRDVVDEIDLNAPYDQFGITYGEAIQKMATALKMTLYGSAGNGQAVPLTDAELIAFVNRQNCSATRKHILTTALSLVGKVPYFWGGKSPPGWNDEWNTPKLVTAAGSSTSGTIRPFGLDCSGFTDWTYKTAVGVSLYGGTWNQWDETFAISASELLPGDLGFLKDSDGQGWNHVLIFAGYGEGSRRMWVHSSGGEGVILNSPSYEASLELRRPKGVDFDAPVSGNVSGTPISTIEVDVTHYCACAKCCGSNADGITASGKKASRGMVAMSSHYPFGTQIMINGTMYTVEDRGGSGIENDIHRVDIFVPDHNEALRLGRYKTTATIYRLGR